MTHEEFQQRYRYNPASDKLGEGGFGKVFKAYDTHRDRWVAIKIAEVKAGLEQVRLKKEVEMVNKLPSHPNIAYYEECYTFSSFAGEYDFGVLQFYEAGNLQQLAERNKLNKQNKESILTQLLEGIAFLHEHGIIHRDLKPQNILIVNRNGEYIPKITDFGISKQLDINKSSVFNNSLAGAGTLSFASPEQLGDKTIRKNTDLWSYGVIAFWLLTGKLPFNTGQHSSTSEAGRLELYKQINTGIHPTMLTGIGSHWQKLINSCLIVDADSRIHKTNDCFNILKGEIPEVVPPTVSPVFSDTEIYEIYDNNSNDDGTLPVSVKRPNKKRTFGLLAFYAISVILALAFILIEANKPPEDYDYGFESTSTYPVEVNDMFQVDLPTELHSLEYIKPEENDVLYGSDYLFFTSVTESDSDYPEYSLKDFAEMAHFNIQIGDNSNVSSLESVYLDNGTEAYRFTYNFTDEDSTGYYVITTVVRTWNHFHQITTWCEDVNQYSYTSTMHSIHNSFQGLY